MHFIAEPVWQCSTEAICRLKVVLCCLRRVRRAHRAPPADGETTGGGYAAAAAAASVKLRIMLRRLWFGISFLLSSVAPVVGEVSLVRSHSVMAARS